MSPDDYAIAFRNPVLNTEILSTYSVHDVNTHVCQKRSVLLHLDHHLFVRVKSHKQQQT